MSNPKDGTGGWSTAALVGMATLTALGALAVPTPAPAQIVAMVDGRRQDIPANTTRTITYAPGGAQRVVDEPWRGTTLPGASVVTTTQTDEEDARGRLRTTVVTRIEPQEIAGTEIAAAIARAAPAPRLAYADPATATDDDAATGEAGTPGPGTIGDGVAGDGAPHAVRIRRGPSGHFVLAILVNGVRVKAIIDTGASGTVLSAEDARATGADHDVVRRTPLSGIGGTTMLAVARVRSFEVAGRALGSFDAAIGAEGIPFTLIGETEIARLGRIEIDGGTMTITPRGTQTASR